ncbi:MAG: hypothetical protein GY861_00950 [bacterium]|nr:hypothetical protein [bacterium]
MTYKTPELEDKRLTADEAKALVIKYEKECIDMLYGRKPRKEWKNTRNIIKTLRRYLESLGDASIEQPAGWQDGTGIESSQK